MKKLMVVLVCVGLMVSMCSCGESYKVLRYAQECLEGVEANSSLQEVYVMKYTTRRMLSDKVLDTDMYEEIPDRGYAVLYHSYVAAEPFSDTYAFFLDSDGDLELSFDYEENYALHEQYYSKFSPYNITAGEMALLYLTNCNYISNMVNYASDYAEDLKGNLETNTWYSLSDKQIKMIR